MGFGLETRDGVIGARVTCDAPGCGAEVDWAYEGVAIASGEGDLRIACGAKCSEQLRKEPNAGLITLEDYIANVVARLGVEIEEGDDADAPDPRHLAAVLTELESVAVLPGVPANVGARQAVEAGYIGAHHVARARSA
jgi:hypothetical protein